MRDLAYALGECGAAVDVYGADCFGQGAKSIGEIFEPPTRWFAGKGLWLGGLSWSPGTRKIIDRAVENCDVVHNHSLWMLPNSYASRAAKRSGKPVVLTAHGALEPWALKHSGWKKKIVGNWFQFQDITDASCIHVNSARERDGIRELGFRNTIAIIPNGIKWDDFRDLPSADPFFALYPNLRNKRIALFMARLHKKKGLQHLLEAWHHLRSDFPDWHMVIAGPDNGYEKVTQSFIAAHDLKACTTLTGPLYGQLKISALVAADLFLHPSFSEGFSMSILEALACGTPALITAGCNFRESTVYGATLEVLPETKSTIIGLRTLLEYSPEELSEMGQRGRSLVQNEYTWNNVARKTLAVYQWLCDGIAKPDFVESRC
jgi:glycosyltransferase involved in cell wall biosynthesis